MQVPVFNFFSKRFMLVFFIAGIGGVGCNDGSSSRKSGTDEILSAFEIAPGFKVELVASEPLVVDPVDMTVDEFGRMYVVEMSGMPLDKSKVGKVVLLSDSSNDGIMDRRTVFADSLTMPSGVMRWKNGIIVTDPPHVYYMEDTDNDGISDIRKMMLTGFDTSNLEGNVNNPEYGYDSWIYLANSPGIKGGNIHIADDPDGARLNESTVRFDPVGRRLESLAGRTQFGHSFDKWGNHLMLNNHYHIYHEVLQARYLNRNPELVVPRATHLLPDHSQVFSIAENPEYQMLTEIGVFTSACGITAYTGGAFAEEYNDKTTFVCEPASNLVHVDRIIDTGTTFKAERMAERKEFLASKDPYSRIVNIYVGPDGALYLADFYRQVIEGPEFMSDEVKSKTNLYNGNDKGRIYRVSAVDAEPALWIDRLQLGNAANDELVKYLAHDNSWWRLNAQRLLIDRNALDVIPLLEKLATDTSATMGRLHALWTLQALGKLDSELIKHALKDPVPGIRINAIKLAELHMAGDPTLQSALYQLQDDPEIKVRFQLVCTLGFLNSAEAQKIRQETLFRDIHDTWMQLAVLSAGSTQAVPLLNGVLANYDSSKGSINSLVQSLGELVGKSEPSVSVKKWMDKALVDPPKLWQSDLLTGLSKGIANRKVPLTGFESERQLLTRIVLEGRPQHLVSSSLNALKVLGVSGGSESKRVTELAVQIASDVKLNAEHRANAVEYIGLSDPRPFENFLKSLIDPRTPAMVQLSAIRTLGRIKGVQPTKFLLDRWSSLTPDVRIESINMFLGDDERVKLLLDRVEAGEINRGSISWNQSVALRSGGSQMNRARKLLTETDENRKMVLGDYQVATTLKGDLQRGKVIYQKNCAVCHQIAGKAGRQFGPDLGTVHAWPLSDVLTNILDPNKSIALGFDTWMIKLNNGKTVQGIITAETPTAITVAAPEGDVSDFARQDIESINTTGISSMPLDFEKKIDKQEMADLLLFLKTVE